MATQTPWLLKSYANDHNGTLTITNNGKTVLDKWNSTTTSAITIDVGGSSTTSDYVYVPTFDENAGNVTFTLGTTASNPEPAGGWHIVGADGTDGVDGKTYVPSVDEAGNLTWTAEGEESINSGNIKGPKGDPGDLTVEQTAALDKVANAKNISDSADIVINEDADTIQFSLNDPYTLTGKSGIKISADTTNKQIVVEEDAASQYELTAGNNITIVKDDTKKTITINSAGGGSGGATYTASEGITISNDNKISVDDTVMRSSGDIHKISTVSGNEDGVLYLLVE